MIVEYHPAIRKLVVEYVQRGNSYQKVADELSMPKSSVATIIRHTKARPAATSCIIVRTVKANPRMSANAIVAMLEKDHGVSVAPQTVRNRINESGRNGRASRKKPYLSKKHKRIRLQYARAYASYTVEDWKKVLFSDESSVEKHGNSGRQLVWRPRGCAFDQRYLTPTFKSQRESVMRYLSPTFKSQRESVMVWGCMSWEGVGALQICDRNVNAQYYMEILEDNIDATKEVLCLPDDTEFLHDGASCHREKTVKEYLRLKGINLVKHPAQSPDLNPIENLWAHVKVQLYQRPATTKGELAERIKVIWYDIDQQQVQTPVLSMPARIRAVIEARGGPTKILRTLTMQQRCLFTHVKMKILWHLYGVFRLFVRVTASFRCLNTISGVGLHPGSLQTRAPLGHECSCRAKHV
ncbi:TPA: LOW QUALITY PROTEIN: hypothetical protein N0F65_011712 [Lagenidium giganteum]|uniref:Transposase n=1 Tax=Lagenidium giganteum TaxID=4803 RepID=A0AAV2YXU2_9STRA|nr:TPA: LOW QUALITY PROTEIN: hypothetical protein N0F65_011712 [Lagenidium giganteum]